MHIPLGGIVFCCGAAVMIMELTGARLLAPWLGSSLAVWTGLIGVVLGCLALGGWLGGRLADRRPSSHPLGMAILGAGFFVGVTALGHRLALSFSADLADSLGGAQGLALAISLGSLLLFGPASVLLGMVSPYAVRLALVRTEAAGGVAGRLYALSTLGSIVGTFLTGFVLVAHLGSERILLGLAGSLALCGAPLAGRRGGPMAAGLAVLLLAGLGWRWVDFREAWQAEAGRHEVDTPYSRVVVQDAPHAGTGRPARVLSTGPRHVQSAVFLDAPGELLLSYTQFLRLAGTLAPRDGAVLTLGGGACVLPRHLQEVRPDLRQEVVELDPGVIRLARERFFLGENPGFPVHALDARSFLRRTRTRYDVIILDVFGGDYAVPFHLASREALEVMRGRLEPGGWLLVNVIGAVAGEGSRLPAAMWSTARAVFPWTGAYRVQGDRAPEAAQNIMLVAGARPLPEDLATRVDEALWAQLSSPARLHEIGPETGQLLTDDFAPTEWLARR